MFKPCDKCGKPGVVDGACIVHAAECKDCGCKIHYSEGVCTECNQRFNDLLESGCRSK